MYKYLISFFLFSFATAFGMQKECTITDTHGKSFSCDQSTFDALSQCQFFKNSTDFEGSYDLSNFNIPAASKSTIELLAACIQNPKKIAEQSFIVACQLLEVADCFEAPIHILSMFANAVWSGLKSPDCSFDIEYKEKITSIAQEHIPCPRNLLRLLKLAKQDELGIIKIIKNSAILNNELHTITFAHIPEYFSFLHGQEYKFYNLDGLTELVDFIAQKNECIVPFKQIILSGHSLEDFCLQDIQKSNCNSTLKPNGNANKIGYRVIDLSGNCIKELHVHQLKKDTKDIISLVTLNNNKINTVHDDVFKLIKQWRIIGNGVTIDLQNNCLSESQKNEITKKLFKANMPLPIRYIKNIHDETTMFWMATLSAILGLATTGTASYFLFNNSSWLIQVPVALIAAGMPSILVLSLFGISLVQMQENNPIFFVELYRALETLPAQLTHWDIDVSHVRPQTYRDEAWKTTINL